MVYILIIDDDVGVRGVLKVIFECVGYEVVVGGDGVEGF